MKSTSLDGLAAKGVLFYFKQVYDYVSWELTHVSYFDVFIESFRREEKEGGWTVYCIKYYANLTQPVRNKESHIFALFTPCSNDFVY